MPLRIPAYPLIPPIALNDEFVFAEPKVGYSSWEEKFGFNFIFDARKSNAGDDDELFIPIDRLY